MEWEKAKNYILIAFLVLNLGLGTLLLLERNRYAMTDEQVRSINNVLWRNNISLYAGLMRRSPPMRPLVVSGFYYDNQELLGIFFDDPAEVIDQDDPEQDVFENEYTRLEIFNGFIFVDNTPGFARRRGEGQIGEVTASDAEALADAFINRHFPDFRRDIPNYRRDIIFGFEGGEYEGIRIIYRQEYRGRLIHSNFVELFITAEGIAQVDMQFGRVMGHGVTRQRIFSPDEALLTFMQRVQHLAVTEPITIRHIDMVYLQEYPGDQPGSDYNAAPFYRIFIYGNDDLPFLINAFTNVIIG